MISVLMLTYNREDMVSRAIKSILVQTCTDFEFIIVDNGSTDRSGQIADDFAKIDSRIKVIHRDKGSIGAGRNTALDATKGDYIAFIDDDDYVEPDFLEFLLLLLTENNADVSICGSTVKNSGEKKVMTAEESVIELMWRKKFNMGFPTKLFKKSLVKELRFPEEVKYDDITLMYRLLANAGIVVYYGLPKYIVCRHEQNTSAWTTKHGLLDSHTLNEYLDAYRKRTEYLSEKFPRSSASFKYFEWSFMISMVEKINRLNIIGCDKQLAYMKDVLSTNKSDFINSKEILDFELEWVKEMI